MKETISANFFYHIYPLGMCGAPLKNDFTSPAGNGLIRLIDRIPHLVSLGITAVYIGPLFESTAHGYDTVDYYHVDRRLGSNEDLARLVQALHANGITVVLDAVFNHTGRHFFAFRDIQEKGSLSGYTNWYLNVDFSRKSPAGDNFMYEGWSGHYDLAKLNAANPAVREHLFGAVKFWVMEFGIDGIRLDAADVLAPDFMDALASYCRSLNPNFWLLGEVVHGDYRNWAKQGRLDSVTNYETYKGLWSSFNDRNFFEIAWSLNRQSGEEGIYRNIPLYNFVDNHDVNRVASILKNPAHLFPLYGLLFTIPGIPSVYYGSEWGIRGEKKNGSDAELRPEIRETAGHGAFSGVPDVCKPQTESENLENAIRNFARIRREHAALRDGTYRQMHVAAEQFVFIRQSESEDVIVAVNSAEKTLDLNIHLHGIGGGGNLWRDALDAGSSFQSSGTSLKVSIPSSWLRILVRTRN